MRERRALTVATQARGLDQRRQATSINQEPCRRPTQYHPRSASQPPDATDRTTGQKPSVPEATIAPPPMSTGTLTMGTPTNSTKPTAKNTQ